MTQCIQKSVLEYIKTNFIIVVITKLTFSCSKSTIETLNNGVKYVQS